MKMWTVQVVAMAAGATIVLSAQQAPALRITSPLADAIVSGPTRIEAALNGPGDVESVSFFANGRLVCTSERPPFGCSWDPGDVVRGHHIRVVATPAGAGWSTTFAPKRSATSNGSAPRRCWCR